MIKSITWPEMPTQQQGATKISFQTLWHLLMPGNLTKVKECDWDVQSKILNSTSSSGDDSSWYVYAGKEKYCCYMDRSTLPAKSSSMFENNNQDSKLQRISTCNYTNNFPRILAMLVCFLACPKGQATDSSWLSSVLVCWYWYSSKPLPSFCCDGSSTVELLRSADLDI